MIAVIVHYTYSGRLYVSLFNDVCVIFNWPRIIEIMNLFPFYCLNSDISITIHVMKLTFSECDCKVLLEGSMSQIFFI